MQVKKGNPELFEEFKCYRYGAHLAIADHKMHTYQLQYSGIALGICRPVCQ